MRSLSWCVWGGLATGRVGQVAATSFYPTKNLGAMGDGGAVLTDSETIASKARELRNYGQSRQYVHDSVGVNSRLDEMQAAILNDAMLPRLSQWTARRRAIAARYLTEIQHRSIVLPEQVEHSNPCWHLFPVVVEEKSRASLIEDDSRGGGDDRHSLSDVDPRSEGHEEIRAV